MGASELHPKHKFNLLVKFTDETYLLVVLGHLGNRYCERIIKCNVISNLYSAAHRRGHSVALPMQKTPREEIGFKEREMKTMIQKGKSHAERKEGHSNDG